MKPKITEKSEKTCYNERPCKRRRVEEKENTHWSVANSAVPPELLADMGVGRLIQSDIYTSEDDTPEKLSPLMLPSSKLDLLTPDNSQEVSRLDKSSPLVDDFFVFRRASQSTAPVEDLFSHLSDEMILMIFTFLPKKTLIRNALVCKRWQRISYDETLWTRLDLSNRSLYSDAMSHVLCRGTSVLRLAQTEFEEPVFAGDLSNVVYKLQYLDLSMAVISEEGLAALLGTCRYLRKLSLEHCRVNEEVCSAIALNDKLEVLNMSLSRGLDSVGVSLILSLCRRLTALNISWAALSMSTVAALCRCRIPGGRLERLNLAGCKGLLQDRDVESLVQLHPMLVELDVSDCTTISTVSITSLLKLAHLEHLALSRCYTISASALRKLHELESLRFLDIYNLVPEAALPALATALPSVKLNMFVCSSIARPTVGIRRTSVWGIRVRD